MSDGPNDDVVKRLLEALDENTTAMTRQTAALQDVCDSLNDMVVCMESGEFLDPIEDFPLSDFSFKAPGSGTA